MKKTFYVLGVASLFAAAAACGGDDSGSGGGSGGRVDTILSLSGDASAGSTTYGTLCGSSSCHGQNGNDGASNAGDLPAAVPGLSDEAIVSVIIDGQGAMPAQSLDDQEVADVLAYCRATFQ